jgi:hypothetical protein
MRYFIPEMWYIKSQKFVLDLKRLSKDASTGWPDQPRAGRWFEIPKRK